MRPWGGLLAILFCPVSALGEVTLPALQGRISRLAPPDAQGEALGVAASARSAAALVGPLLMTGAFAWGASVEGAHLLGAPYVLGAALMLLCVALVMGDRAPEPQPAT
jgi:DHA1 family tetracycline resistance protein-like MFS transporter